MNISSIPKNSLAIALAAAFLTAPTFSFAITVTDVDGSWQNPNGGTAITFNPTGDQIRWGTPATAAGKSGFNFNAASGDLVVDPNEQFVLGTFDHVNNPVFGSGPSQVDLEVNFNIVGADSSPNTALFQFEFTETLNGANPCAIPGTVSPCPDLVGFSNNGVSESVVNIGGTNFDLQILGFQVDGNLVEEFVTAENATNTAPLLARFVQSQSTIPEPGTVILFGTGLAGLAIWRIRQTKKT